MGWEGAAIVPYLENEIKQNGVDVIAHIGDIAYNMDTDNGRVGDGFLRMIEPVASAVPYMTTMGNHEQAQYVLNELQVKFEVRCTLARFEKLSMIYFDSLTITKTVNEDNDNKVKSGQDTTLHHEKPIFTNPSTVLFLQQFFTL